MGRNSNVKIILVHSLRGDQVLVIHDKTTDLVVMYNGACGRKNQVDQKLTNN